MSRKVWIVDWKSSKGIYLEYKLQLAAYYGILFLSSLNYGIEAECVGILRLDKETGLPEFVDCTERVQERWEAFLALRRYYRIVEEPAWRNRDNRKCYPFNGKEFPTVTTILSILDKPALVQWAANMVSDHFAFHLPELRNPNTPPERIDYIMRKAKTAHREISKKAKDTGTIVHEAIDCYLSGGKPEDILGENEKATNAFLAFLDWKDRVKMEPIWLEKQLISPEFEVGGTTDFIGYLDI